MRFRAFREPLGGEVEPPTVALLAPDFRRRLAAAHGLLAGGADKPVHTPGKGQDPEVLRGKEIVLAGLVCYPQLAVRLGFGVWPDFVDLPVLEAGRILTNLDADGITQALERGCFHGSLAGSPGRYRRPFDAAR